MQPFRLFGRPIVLGRYAEIHFPPAWKYSAVIRDAVEEILDGVEEWDPSEFDTIVETLELDAEFVNPTARIDASVPGCAQPMWARHRAHTSRLRQLSPFVEPQHDDIPVTNLLTLELAGTPDRPVFARLYPGDEIMPLPWQSSILFGTRKDQEASAAYWRTHAFVANDNYHSSTVTTDPPEWFIAL